MGSPYRHGATPEPRPCTDREVASFEAAIRATRSRGRLRAFGLLAGLVALTLAPMVTRAPDLRPPTRDLAVVRPAFGSPARTLLPVTAPPLPAPWGPPCDPAQREACDF